MHARLLGLTFFWISAVLLPASASSPIVLSEGPTTARLALPTLSDSPVQAVRDYLVQGASSILLTPAQDSQLQRELESLLDVLDNNEISKEEQLRVYADHIVHMAPNQEAITGKPDLLDYLRLQSTYGRSEMEHRILAFEQHGDVVVLRGEVVGTFYPSDGADGMPFRTKNLFVLERIDGILKIAQVIFNMAPTP